MAKLEELRANVKASIDFVRGIGHLQMSPSDRLLVELNSALATVIDDAPPELTRSALQDLLALLPTQQDLGSSMKDLMVVSVAKTIVVAVDKLLPTKGHDLKSSLKKSDLASSSVDSKVDVVDTPAAAAARSKPAKIDRLFSMSRRSPTPATPAATRRTPRDDLSSLDSDDDDNDGNNEEETKKLSCPHCKQSYARQPSLTQHLMAKHYDIHRAAILGSGGFACPSCAFISSRFSSVAEHIKAHHVGRKAELIRRLSLQRDSRGGGEEKAVKTKMGGDEQEDKEGLVGGGRGEASSSHVAKARNKTPRIRHCVRCKKRFLNATKYARHFKNNALCSSALEASRRQTPFPNQRRSNEAEYATNEPLHRCVGCNKTFAKQVKYAGHFKSSPSCSEALRASRRSHALSPQRSNKDTGRSRAVSEAPNTTTSSTSCTYCGRTISKSHLGQHIKGTHPEIYAILAVHKCAEPGCNYAVPSISAFRNHQHLKHGRRYNPASGTPIRMEHADTTEDAAEDSEDSKDSSPNVFSSPKKECVRMDNEGNEETTTASVSLALPVEECQRCQAGFSSYLELREHIQICPASAAAPEEVSTEATPSTSAVVDDDDDIMIIGEIQVSNTLTNAVKTEENGGSGK